MTAEHWTPEPIVGWRLWVWQRDSLKSVTINQRWNREMPPATCNPVMGVIKAPHESPHEECLCGYWSLKPHLLASPRVWGAVIWQVRPTIQLATLGWVESWGTTWEYEHGYRSEHIRISALIDLDYEWVRQHMIFEIHDSGEGVPTRYESMIWQHTVFEFLPEFITEYQRRLHEAAEAYNVPIVHISDRERMPA